jgi:hypothetical protein
MSSRISVKMLWHGVLWVLLVGEGKGERKNWNKIKKNVLSFPKNLLHRAVQNIKSKLR